IGIRDDLVTGVQTCALPISGGCSMTPSIAAALQPVRLDMGDVTLDADLSLAREGRGLVVFAHGSGSGRHSRRNRAVAEELQHGEIGRATGRGSGEGTVGAGR